MLKLLSLFSGIGAFEKALTNLEIDYELVGFSEIDKWAIESYCNIHNVEAGLSLGDISEIDTKGIPSCDIITFGFPCTSFSIAGYRKGFADEHKGHLFFETLRIIRASKPKVIFLENVRNLVNHDEGKTFQIIKDSLEDAGYHLKYKVMNSLDYGNIPQNRERVYVVGFKDKEYFDKFYFPTTIPLSRTIHDITKPNEKKPEKYYYGEDSQYYEMLKEEMTKVDTVYQLRRVYVRENKSNVCPTLTANMGTGGHNVPLIVDDYGIRKLIPLETWRLMGFTDDDYWKARGALENKFYNGNDRSDSQMYKQAGNSIVVNVLETIFGNMRSILE